MARLQGLIPVQRVPSSSTNADQRRPLSIRERRFWKFHRRFVWDTNVFCEDTILWSAQTVVPILDRAIERGRIESNDNLVSGAEPRNRFTNLVHLAHGIRAGDDILLDWKRIFRHCDGEIAEVQRNAADFHEKLVSVDRGNVFGARLEAIETVAVRESEGDVGRHFVL